MTNKRINRLAFILLTSFAFLVLCGPIVTPARADTPMFGVRGGAYTGPDEPFFGAEVQFDAGARGAWQVNPNVEHVFMDSGGMTDLSCDFHYDIPNGTSLSWWTGGGPTLIFRNPGDPEDDSSRDLGVNLLVGAGARKGDVRPYGQVKVIVSNDTEAAFGFGVRF